VPATRDEIAAAALQFVRKVSGSRKPSRVNEPAFDAAVDEIAGSVEKLLGRMDIPRSRAGTRTGKTAGTA
jgi:hypothetical protein